jgi:hypothetical protein
MGRPAINLTGYIFGIYHVEGIGERPNDYKHKSSFWKCRCSVCGTLTLRSRHSIMESRNEICTCDRKKRLVLEKPNESNNSNG